MNCLLFLNRLITLLLFEKVYKQIRTRDEKTSLNNEYAYDVSGNIIAVKVSQKAGKYVLINKGWVQK